MTSVYDRVWTIRGLVDVGDDIHLLPGDRLRILPNVNGSHRIVMIDGDRAWESCDNLIENGKVPPTIALAKPDSVNMADGGAYHMTIRRFLDDDHGELRKLVGTLKVDNSTADVTVWAPKSAGTGREILVLRAVHREGGKHQNGTGHGDWH